MRGWASSVRARVGAAGRRLSAARHPARGARALARVPDWARGARSLAAFGFSFGVATAIDGLHYGVFAALGCYVDAYGARSPYPRRGPLLAVLAAGFAAAMLLGSLAAGATWLMVAVLTLVAYTATLFVRTLHLSGPGGYFVVLVAALTAFLPHAPGELPLRAGYLLLGAAASWLAAMSGWLVRPCGPEERACATAFRRVADVVADGSRGPDGPKTADGGKAPDGPEGWADGRGAGVRATGGRTGSAQVRARWPDGRADRAGRRLRGACLALHGAWTALDDARGVGHARPHRRRLLLHFLMLRLEDVLDAAAGGGRPGLSARPAPTPRQLRCVAADVAAGREPEAWPVPPPDRSTADPPASSAAPRAADPLWPAPLPPRDSLLSGLRRLLSRSSPMPPVALRVALAVAAGTALGAVLPLVHPAWVAVGAAAALQGGPGQQPAQRATARLAGTVCAVGVTALAFHSYQPGTAATVGLAAVLHAASRMVSARSVSATMALNTPVALLLVNAGTPGAGLGRLAAFRLIDLTLGLLVGVVASVLVRGVPRWRVRTATARAVRALGPALRERMAAGAVDTEAVARAWQRMADLWTMYGAVPVEEFRSSGTADRLWPVVLATRRLLLWSVTPRAVPRDVPGGERVQHCADALADAARTARPPTGTTLPALPLHPALHTRLDALRSALAGPYPEAAGGGWRSPRPPRPPRSLR